MSGSNNFQNNSLLAEYFVREAKTFFETDQSLRHTKKPCLITNVVLDDSGMIIGYTHNGTVGSLKIEHDNNLAPSQEQERNELANVFVKSLLHNSTRVKALPHFTEPKITMNSINVVTPAVTSKALKLKEDSKKESAISPKVQDLLQNINRDFRNKVLVDKREAKDINFKLSITGFKVEVIYTKGSYPIFKKAYGIRAGGGEGGGANPITPEIYRTVSDNINGLLGRSKAMALTSS